MQHIRTWLICLLLAMTGCATDIGHAPARLEVAEATRPLATAVEVERQAVEAPMQTMLDIEPVEDNVLATILEGFQTNDWLPYENGRAPPVNVAQVTTNPMVTGICPPGTQSVTGVLGQVGNCEPLPSFAVALQSSLVPERAQSSLNPGTLASNAGTFTRATTAYQTDFEGKLNLALAGEARFQGARRVRNLFTVPQDPTTWTKTNVTAVVGATDPLGGAFGITVTATGANGQTYFGVAPTSPTLTFRNSIYVRRVTGVGAVKLRTPTGSALSDIDISASLTTSFKRFSLAASLNDGVQTAYPFVLTLATSGDVVVVAFPQLEDVTGQANQNPSEYVPALAAANADSNAIGVRYFTTLNGNTVASNVVTEATGAAINSGQAACAGGVTAGVVDASGPLGYLAEGVRTNLLLQSNAFTTTWSSTGVIGSITQNAVAPDGTTTAWTLQSGAGTDSYGRYQSFTYTAAAHTFSIIAKAGTYNYLALDMNNGANAGAVFDLSNGTIGFTDAGVTSTITPLAGGRYLCQITKTMTAAGGFPEFYLSGSRTSNTRIWLSLGTETVIVSWSQLEAASFASSYIPTTTLAVQRNADVLTYPSAGNISGTQGSVYAEYFNANWSLMTNPVVIGGSGGVEGIPLYANSTNAARAYDGTNAPVIAAVPSGMVKGASMWGGSSMQVFANGSAGVATAFDGNISVSTIAISNAASSLFGTIRNVRIYPTALPAARLQAITADATDWLLPKNWAVAANDDWYRIAANGR